GAAAPRARPRTAAGPQEHSDRTGSHQDQLQQHDRLADRPRGQRHRVGVRRRGRLQGLAQVDTLRRSGHRRLGRPQGHRAGPREGRGLRARLGLGPRDRHSLAAGRRPRGHGHARRHPAGPQRRAPQEAPEGL
ncbi:MAG: SSU ribosomal protein S11p (S14e), partial [uncultured Solirubrobacterales bacterium]